MNQDIDPEVAADLALRERTARERKGLSAAQFGAAIREAATPARVVDRVPCRARCGSMVDWTQEAEEQFAMFNRQLASRSDAPLDKTRIMFCNACRIRGAAVSAEANRKKADAMAEVVKKFKAATYPERETELLDKAKKLGHPDIAGMLEAIRIKRTATGGKRVRAGEVNS